MVKNILISGGANGLGYEISKLLSKKNNIKLIILDRDKKLINIAQELKVDYILTDLSQKLDFNLFNNKLDKIDCFINNASYVEKKNFDQFNYLEIDKQINLNILSPILLVNYLIKKNPAIKVINILSTTIFFPTPTYALYSSCKTFVLKFFDNLFFENTKNLKVNNIIIGSMNTNFSEDSKNKNPNLLISDKLNIAKKIIKIIFENKKNKNFYIGLNAKIVYLAFKLIPYFLYKKIFVFLFKIIR